jgi:hypothetical protein
MALLWTLGLLAVWLLWVSAGTTNAAFESSEGGWSDREAPEEGRDMRRIRAHFEDFRQTCNRPSATMYRTTSRNPFNALAWWNYLIDPKWQLPYRAPRVSPVPASSCASP